MGFQQGGRSSSYGNNQGYGSRGGGYGGGNNRGSGYGDRNGRFGGGGNSYGGGARHHHNDVVHEYQQNPDFSGLPPFVKDFYEEHPDVTAMSQAEVEKFRASHQMVLQGGNIPRPMTSFKHAKWPAEISEIFEKSGFDTPTPIQGQGWPMALSGRNVIGIAQTGSGKTLSFVLPSFVHIKAQAQVSRGDGPVCLILAPTRELACQIHEVVRQYGNPIGIRHACLYGGASKGPQIGELNRSPHVVVATPGRLLDLLKMGKTTLKRVTYLVLDEADRMLDMGFEEPLREIVSQIRPDRQMLFWSATWPKSVQHLARDLQGNDAIQVRIGSQKLQANRAIKQSIMVISESEKDDRTLQILDDIWKGVEGSDEKSKAMERTIIFSNKKYDCDRIERGLKDSGWKAISIHGDKDQRQRDHALACFKRGDIPILVATDVAARGLDVKELKHVINFDFPNNVEDYVHRVGRTGRGGSSGFAYTFFDPKIDRKSACDLVQLLQDAQQEIPQELLDMASRNGKSGNNGGGRFGGRFGGGGRGRYGGGGGRNQGGNRSYRPY